MRRAVGAPPVAPFGRMLLMQTWSRLLWFWRIPAWTVSSLAMPVFFFTFFGLRFAHRSGFAAADLERELRGAFHGPPGRGEIDAALETVR